MVIVLGFTAEKAWSVFSAYQSGFKPFRDATMGVCTYRCTVLDCIQGLEYGIKLGWYNYKTFNYKEYEYYEKVEHGDFNWIVPGKFLAFSGPSNKPRDSDGWRTFTPEDYAPIFKKMGVTSVVRLNQKMYDREVSFVFIYSVSLKKDLSMSNSSSSMELRPNQRLFRDFSKKPKRKRVAWQSIAKQDSEEQVLLLASTV